jgi:peroxiredoxin
MNQDKPGETDASANVSANADHAGTADPAASTSAPGHAPTADPPPAGRGRWIASATAALGVALFAVPFIRGPEPSSAGTSQDPGSGPTCATSKGRAQFDFTLQDMNGDTVRLSDYKGKVILLNFWATWCGPCKVEIPEFIEAYDQYRDRGFVILGVLSQDDPSPEDLRAFASGWGMNYPILREQVELDEAFGPLWAIPTSFIIDRQGSICTKHMGPVSKEMLEREIKGLL